MLTFIKHYTLRFRWFIVLFLLLLLALLLFFRPENKAMPRPRVISDKGLYKLSYKVGPHRDIVENWPDGVAISKDNLLLTAIPEIQLLHLADGKEVWREKSSYVNTDKHDQFEFSPNGQLFAIAGYDQLEIRRTEDNTLVHKLPYHDIDTSTIAFSPDGQFLASGGYFDYLVKVWRVSDGALVYTMTQHTQPVNRVIFSADNQWLLSGSHDNTVRIWRMVDGVLIHTIKLPKETLFIYDIAISDDGHYLAIGNGSFDLWVWDLIEMKFYKKFDVGHIIFTVAFIPNTTIVATGDYGGVIQFWDVPNGKLLQKMSSHQGHNINKIAFSADGDYFASVGNDNQLEVWQAIEP